MIGASELRLGWEAIARRDRRALEAFVGKAAEADPTQVLALAETEPGREVARAWFEAVSEAVDLWLETDERAPARLLEPHEGGFELGALLLLPMYLREVGSPRVDPAPWPEKLGPRELAKAMLRSDAHAPLDYAKVARAIEPWTRPALVTWFLGCYLASPLESIDERVIEHRARAIASFEAHHEHRVAKAPFTLALGASAFSAPSMTGDPRAFLQTLSRAVLEPAFAGRGARGSRSERAGVVLTVWGADTAVHRCMAPVMEGMKPAQRYVLDPRSGAARACASPKEIAALADEIAREDLDFLFYPEVGLTNASRFLATRRLARVQAAGYGHPVTTGSGAMDYFVGGAAVEGDGSDYSERLVLLPGLGVSSLEPPPPSASRARPEDAKEPIFVSLASYNKLGPELCAAWERALSSIPNARLDLVASLPARRTARVAQALEPRFTKAEVNLIPRLSRQACIDLLAEADVYLDSFPFGGYNTLVEALACGLPVVTLEGRRAYGRYGAALLRELELPEWLIAKTAEEYVAAAIKLGTDHALRKELRARLERPRVLARLCRRDVAAHFEAAVEWMRRAGPTRGAPVFIEAGSPARVR